MDVAIEAVGIPTTFDFTCQKIIGVERLPTVVVHGKPVGLGRNKLWIHQHQCQRFWYLQIQTLEGHKKIEPEQATHYFKLSEIKKPRSLQ